MDEAKSLMGTEEGVVREEDLQGSQKWKCCQYEGE